MLDNESNDHQVHESWLTRQLIFLLLSVSCVRRPSPSENSLDDVSLLGYGKYITADVQEAAENWRGHGI